MLSVAGFKIENAPPPSTTVIFVMALFVCPPPSTLSLTVNTKLKVLGTEEVVSHAGAKFPFKTSENCGMYLTGDKLGIRDLQFGPSVFVEDGILAAGLIIVASSFSSQQYVNTSPEVPVPVPVNLNAVLTGIVYAEPCTATPGFGLVTDIFVLTGHVLVAMFDCICATLL